jgi:hypothetical protein
MSHANDVIHATPDAMRDIPRRKGTRADLILQDGPPTLCVIIGTPQGRWHAEFQSRTREASHSGDCFVRHSTFKIWQNEHVNLQQCLALQS